MTIDHIILIGKIIIAIVGDIAALIPLVASL
jgi:hypothetical protein